MISRNTTLAKIMKFHSKPEKRSRPEEPGLVTPKRKKLNPVAPRRLNSEGQEKTKEPSNRFRVTSYPENIQNQTVSLNEERSENSDQNTEETITDPEIIEEKSETSDRNTEGTMKNPEIVEVNQLSVADILKEKISSSQIKKIIQEPTNFGIRTIYELAPKR